jgi:hypothetical protein
VQRAPGVSLHLRFAEKLSAQQGGNDKFFNVNKVLLGSFCEENCTAKL